MQPPRLSSEAPEVVSRIPDKFFVPYLNRSPRSALFQKHIHATSALPPYTTSSEEGSSRSYEDEQNQGFTRGSCGLVTILLVIGAFLLGGGIGGGVGGAFISKDRAKIAILTSSLAVLPTVTVTGSPAPTACFVDQAGCPNINNTTYKSTTPGYSFIQICGVDIISTTGESIDISSKVETSWDACMDSCADYNEKDKQGGCQGATWQIFSATDPKDNSMCTLKSIATETGDPQGSDQLCSGVLQS